MAILQDQTKLPNGQARPTYEQLLAELIALRAARSNDLRLEFNDKPYTDKAGVTHPATYSITLWGLSGRKPITLNAQSWQRLADFMPTVLEFADDHPVPAKR